MDYGVYGIWYRVWTMSMSMLAYGYGIIMVSGITWYGVWTMVDNFEVDPCLLKLFTMKTHLVMDL